MATPEDDNVDARNSQNSILSAKVSRALEVRSDTPAMKAALDALAHLPDHQDDLFSVDSRSVRVAIEQDALQQALLLQDELRTLLDTVSQLRQGVSDVSSIAQRVEEAIHTNVMTANLASSTGHGEGSKSGEAEDTATSSGQMVARGADDQSLEQEQRLATLLSEAFSNRNASRKRVEAVAAFLEKFDLSEEDSRLLDHYSFEDVETSNVNGLAFLAALERVRLIRKELGRTFGTLDFLHSQRQQNKLDSSGSNESSRMGTTSALRMMENLAQKQERAYERLYHWLQKYLHVHDVGGASGNAMMPQDDDSLDEALSHPFVRRSLYTLRNVPAFYSHLLELIAGSRRSEETRRFLLALTSGYGGLPPIEMRAHDAVSYTGDMLAFCFRAFSVEADVARGLLDYVPEVEESKEEEEENDEVKLAEEDPDYLVEKTLTAAEMLAQSMGGVSRPLKSRIIQVISNLSRRPDEDDQSDDGLEDTMEEEGNAARTRLSQLYEMCGLLLFYASAIGKTMAKLEPHGEKAQDDHLTPAERNPLQAAMYDCLEEASKAYEASLRVHGAMLEQLNLLTGDSEASSAQAMLVRLVEVQKTSPGFTGDVDCPKSCKQTLSLDFACDVLVEAALPSCKSLDDAVTLRQSISMARQGDLTSDVASNLEKKVHETETSLIDVLVEKETTDVLDLCGLGSLVTAWDRFKGVQVDGMVMANHPGLTPEEVQTAMKEFYSSLYSPPLPSFESTIKDPTLRKLARTKIATNVCSAYQTLYDAMTKTDKGGYDDLEFLGHTPEQVKTLFTV